MPYHHLFFDLDHTLWDFDANARESLEEIYIEMNLSQVIYAPFDEFYITYLQHNKVLWERYHNGFITQDELKWKRMWRTLLHFKIGDELLAKNMSVRFLELLPYKKKVFPHTNEILNYLSNKNYLLHLITNGFHTTQWNKLKSSGLDKYFSYVITSESSNSLKPKKEIFDFALNTADAKQEHSIMIGDNIEADINGALNAGWDCIFVNHTGEEISSGATYTVKHLKELEQIF